MKVEPLCLQTVSSRSRVLPVGRLDAVLPLSLLLWVVGLLTLILAPTQASAQQIQVLGTESGGLQAPLANVVVQMLSLDGATSGQGKLLLTDNDGFIDVPFKGKTVVSVSYVGYEKRSDTIDFEAGKSYEMSLQAIGTQLPEAVITAQYTPDAAENSTFKIRVINRQRIESQGAVNLRDLLTNELNIRVAQDNVLGSSMSLQGLTGQNIKILVDGVPVIGRLDGNIDISQLNLNNIERIEIVEGPMSVVYGTDAIGGVINLITKKNQVKPIKAGANLFYESSGHYNVDISLGYQAKRMKYQLNGGRYFFGGWSPSGIEDGRQSQWKPKEQYFGNFSADYTHNSLRIRLQPDVYYEKLYNLGAIRQTPTAIYAFDEFFHTFRSTNGLFVNWYPTKIHVLDVITNVSFYSRTRETIRKDMTTLETQPVYSTGGQDTTQFMLYMSRATFGTIDPDRRLNYQVGYDFNVETTSGQRILNDNQYIGDFAGFISAEWKPVPRLTLRPAFRYAYNTKYQAPPIPSFNVRYTLGDFLTLRASYSRGFRAPSLKELYFYFVDINHNIQGNPDLRAETSNNYNASASAFWTKPFGQFKVELSGFYTQVDQLISLAVVDFSRALYSYVNVGKFQSLGGILNVSYQYKGLKLEAGGSYVGRDNQPAGSTQNLGFQYSPELRLNATYRFEKIKLEVATFYKYNGRVLTYYIDEDQNVATSFIDSFHTLDITVTKNLLDNRIALTVGGRNLFNVQNVASQLAGTAHSGGSNSVPMGVGRTVFATLRLNF